MSNSKKLHSDSKKNVNGKHESVSADQNLSITDYDEIMKLVDTLQSLYSNLELGYIEYVEFTKILQKHFKKSHEECQKLQEMLDVLDRENSDLEEKLVRARKFLDKEKKNTKNAEKERNLLEIQIAELKEFILNDTEVQSVMSEDRLSKLTVFETDRTDQLRHIPESNSTDSVLSDFSYSKSEDDLDTSKFHAGKIWKMARPSMDAVSDQPAMKPPRSSEHKVVEIGTSDIVRAKTTVTMARPGPMSVTSVIEVVPQARDVPPYIENVYPSSVTSPKTLQEHEFSSDPIVPSDGVFQSRSRNLVSPTLNRINLEKEKYETDLNKNEDNIYDQKRHVFQKRTVVLPDNCGLCQSRLRFGRMAWKCKECKNLCHAECKDKLPLPCIPVIHTANQAMGLSVIGDYTGTTAPMVPPLIIHCVNEIEHRETNKVGLYRVSGSEKEVKILKEKFLKGKAAPSLNNIDVHVLCGVIKDFLRYLQEPLITKALRKDFVSTCEENDVRKMKMKISDLPQPNRDTLAYMILHLQRISQKKEIKMPAENLAIVFGPTIVGYSSEHICSRNNRHLLPIEKKQQVNVLKYLIELPSSYWEMFVNITASYGSTILQQTPSTDSLLQGNVETPKLIHGPPKRRGFFPSPPTRRFRVDLS